jgi:hypothetical protein
MQPHIYCAMNIYIKNPIIINVIKKGGNRIALKMFKIVFEILFSAFIKVSPFKINYIIQKELYREINFESVDGGS